MTKLEISELKNRTAMMAVLSKEAPSERAIDLLERKAVELIGMISRIKSTRCEKGSYHVNA